MADNSIQGSNLVMKISTDGVTYKTLVCEEDSQMDKSNDVTTTKTKCFTAKGISAVDVNLSGNAVCNASPTTEEVSYSNVSNWQDQKTLLYFEYKNEAQGAFAAGELVNATGVGYFTQSTITAATDDVLKFSWTFSVTDLTGDISS
jgi:hypothetical protein